MRTSTFVTDIDDAGVTLGEGERIQAVISSWAWPGYARNLNTLEPQTTAREPVVATTTVYSLVGSSRATALASSAVGAAGRSLRDR